MLFGENARWHKFSGGLKMYMDALACLLLVIIGLGGMAAVALMEDALANKKDFL